MKRENLIYILIGIVCVGLLPNARPLAAQSRRLDDAPFIPNSNVQEAWVARYNAENDTDQARAIAVDGSGNVYVTGRSYTIESWTDYATIKYSSTGQQQWIAHYNGPLNSYDEARAIAVDGSGNVYVTGWSYGVDGYSEYATIKYDSAGQEQWVARYNGPGIGHDSACAIALDTFGNIYVTGSSTGLGGSADSATIKYNSAGQQQWVARCNSVGPAAIVVDASGNAYVTGGSGEGYATIKYDPDGEEQWVAHYNGSPDHADSASAIAIDGLGNIYVTGRSYNIRAYPDYATIKYNSAGEEQWVARYVGPAGGLSDEPAAIVVDNSGNAYVTGVSVNTDGTGDYATIKYNSAGQRQWLARYNGLGGGNDLATAIALDSLGNIYVTGRSDGRINFNADYATVKYDWAGQEQWVARYNGFGIGDDVAAAIAVDAKGNVYVTGYSVGSGTGDDWATVKYEPTRPSPTPKPRLSATPRPTPVPHITPVPPPSSPRPTPVPRPSL